MSAGSATCRQRFHQRLRQLELGAGDLSSKTFTVPIKDDSLNENNETISLGLSSPTGGATLGSQKTAIVDDSRRRSHALGQHF
jgi:hypothetical protein